MRVLILISLVIVYVSSQTIHGHDLNALADRIFKSMDVDHDGEITVAEMDAGSKYIDKDANGHITCEEYATNANLPHDLALEVFKHYDPDGDCEMTHADSIMVLKNMDQSGDGHVNMHEFEHFFTQIMKHLGHTDHSQHGK